MRRLTGALALAWIACTPRPSEATPVAAAVDAGPRCSGFHVAVLDTYPGQVWLCPVHGSTLVCQLFGSPLQSTPAGVVSSDELTRGAPMSLAETQEQVITVVGHWPEAAWRLAGMTGPGGRATIVAKRWNGAAWEPFASWLGRVSETTPAVWQGGLLLDHVRTTGLPTEGAGLPEEFPLRIVRQGGAQEPVPDALVGKLVFSASAATVGESLFVLGHASPQGLEVRISQHNQVPARIDPIASDDGDGSLWAGSERDVVAFGSTGPTPLLTHWNGSSWTSQPVPAGVERVVAFDRTSSGAERIFAREGQAVSLWERTPGAAWRSIDLPHLDLMDTVDRQWLQNGEVWIHVHDRAGHGRLLRDAPVKHVYRVGVGPEAADTGGACLGAE